MSQCVICEYRMPPSPLPLRVEYYSSNFCISSVFGDHIFLLASESNLLELVVVQCVVLSSHQPQVTMLHFVRFTKLSIWSFLGRAFIYLCTGEHQVLTGSQNC